MHAQAVALLLSAVAGESAGSPPAIVIVETACTPSSGCGAGLVCSRLRDLGAGRRVGVCRAPELLTPATGTSPDRFRYLGAVPEGFHLMTERRWGLISAGGATFLLSYLPTAAWGLVVNEALSLIPCVGPFALMTKLYRPGGIIDSGAALGLIAVGAAAVQLGGLVMLLSGLVSSRHWMERDVAMPKVSIAPGAMGAPLGASLVGRF